MTYKPNIHVKLISLIGGAEEIVQSDKINKMYIETKDEFWRRVEAIQGGNLDKPVSYTCGVDKCPDGYFTFHLKSGIANILGPRICFEGNMLMSGVANNIGRGINIALLKGDTGEVLKSDRFDMYSGKPEPVVEFLSDIEKNTIVLVVSYDEPALLLTSQIRELFSDLGSTEITTLSTRDSWVFAGAQGIIGKSPFERTVKNEKNSNQYEGWPAPAHIAGCFPVNPYGKQLNRTLT